MPVSFILLVIATQCFNVIYGLSNNRRHETIIKAPHIGYVNNKSKSLEVYVCGTSHFKCNSPKEVTNLIEEIKPDGVVLELDPERVIRLTKQYAGFDQNGSNIGQYTTDELIYGADFAASIEIAQKLDIPLFLGDEYAQETKSRLIRDVFNVKKYSPRPLLNSIISGTESEEDNAECVRINILQMFATDPDKLRPLLIAGFPPFLFAVIAFFFDNGTQEGSGSLLVLETVVSIIVSFLAVSFLFNTVIVERDEILTASTLQASEILRSLKDNKSIRKKWSFAVKKKHEEDIEDTTLDNKESLPLFTLKTPLIKDGIRNLNLFEPRWLKMIDEVTRGTPQLDERIFGCVRCTNKFYSAISVNGEEGRFADIIFEKQGIYATIKELNEGHRPVSGDRRIHVKIEGREAFIVDENNLSVSSDGYMVAKQVVKPTVVDSDNFNYDTLSSTSEEGRESSIRIVVVVGLLHANGVETYYIINDTLNSMIQAYITSASS